MPIIETEYIDVLQESLNERDKQLQEKKLPEINIASAIPVSESLEFGIDSLEYGVTKLKGSVKDGIIGHQTTSLKTIDSQVEFKKATVVQWAKAATWTRQELEKVARLNISLQTKKQDDLHKNALILRLKTQR